MKLRALLFSTFYVTTLLLTSCSKNKDLNVQVKDSDTEYSFTAQYNRDKTLAVQQYVNAALKPNRIFADHQEKIAKDIRLADGSVFRLESSPGDFSIEFGKKDNSDASYENIRKICSGIKEIVTEK